jgi:hypothetical protein
MNATERTTMFQVRMSDEEISMLRALAERKGVTASDFVRLFVRDAFAATFGDKPPKKPKPKK